VITTTASAAQALEAVCDECAGDGQLAYDLETTMWVPCNATADWSADDCMAISVLDCLTCNATAPARGGAIRDAAIVRRDPAGNYARAGCSVRRSSYGTVRISSQTPLRARASEGESRLVSRWMSPYDPYGRFRLDMDARLDLAGGSSPTVEFVV
jgi:hypothetical protein